MEQEQKICLTSNPCEKDSNEASQNPALMMSAETSSFPVPTSLQAVEQSQTSTKLPSLSQTKSKKRSKKRKNCSGPGSETRTESTKQELSNPSTSMKHNTQRLRAEGKEDEAIDLQNTQQTSQDLKNSEAYIKQEYQQGGGGAAADHGNTYHKMVSMLLIIKLYKQAKSEEGFEYTVQFEKSGYGKFDDIIVRYKKKNEKWVEICFQCKHKKKEIELTASNIIDGNDKNYLWYEYVNSYVKIETENEKPDEERLYALITNNTFNCQIIDTSKPTIKFEKKLSTSAKIICDFLNCNSYKIISECIQRAVETVKSAVSVKNQKFLAYFLKKMHLWCTEDTEQLKEKVHMELAILSNNNTDIINEYYNRLYREASDLFGSCLEITGKDIKYWFKKEKFVNLPGPCHEFTGRSEQLLEMKNQLTKKNEKDIDVVISGMHGIGKTQLALQFAELYKDNYDYIIWINATSPETIFTSFNDVAKHFSIPQIEKNEKEKNGREHPLKQNDCETSLQQIQNVYSYLHGICLFIFDNGNKFLTQRNNNKCLLYLPQKKRNIKHRFIVTTTYSDLNCNKRIKLDLFNINESLQFLKNNFKDQEGELVETEDDLKELSQIFNRWPLPLSIASGFIKEQKRNSLHSKYTIQKFLKDYNSSPDNVHIEEEDWYIHSISSLWTFIRENITDTSKNALFVLNTLSFCNSDKIPISLFKNIEDRDIKLILDMSLVQLDRENNFLNIHCTLQTEIRRSLENENNLRKILQQGLIIFHEFLNVQNITPDIKENGALHAVKFWNHSKQHVEKNATFNNMPKIILSIVKNLYGHYEQIKKFATDALNLLDEQKLIFISCQTRKEFAKFLELNGYYQEALQHVDYVLSIKVFTENQLELYECKVFQANLFISLGSYTKALIILNELILKNSDDDNIDLLHDKASVLVFLCKYEEALKMFDHVIKMRRLKFGENHPDTLASMHNKANVLDDMGKYEEALVIYDYVIKIEKEKFGEDHIDTVSSMHSKASLLENMGKYVEALAIYDHVIKIRREKLGEDHPDTLTSMHNNASVLDSMGKYEEALAVYDLLVKMRIDKLGDDHPYTLSSNNNKALLLHKIGKYEDAVAIFDHVIKIRRQKLGEDHPNTLETMHNKALVLDKMGKYDKALVIYNHVIKMKSEKIGEDHPDTLICMNNMALVLKNMAKYEEALAIYDHVIKIEREKFGEDHTDTIISMNNKVLVLDSMGKYEEALIMCNNLIKLRREKLGEEHPETLAIMHYKALVLGNNGKYEKALAIYDQVINMRKKKLGEDHPDTLTSMHNKASVLEDMCKYEEAYAIYDYVIKMRREKLGEDHPFTLSSMQDKALVLYNMDKYEDAIVILDSVIKIKKLKLGENHPDTLASMHNKAIVLENMGEYEEALAMYDHVIKMEREKLGDDKPETLTSMHSKASVLDKIGKYEEALAIYDHVIKMRRDKLGDDHSETLISMHNKASVLDKIGKYEEALVIYDYVIKMEKETLGDDQPETITSMHSKASVLDNMGKYEEALALYDHVIKIRREELGEDHPDTLSSIKKKASVLKKIGQNL